MKIIPRKFEAGGLWQTMTPNFIKYSFESSSGSSDKKTSEASEESEFKLKDLLEYMAKLFQHGDKLDSDLIAIQQNFNQIYSLHNRPSLPGRQKNNTGHLLRAYSEALIQLEIANNNYKEYLHAQKEITDHKGLNEIAIVDVDKVAVIDKQTGKMTEASVQEYLSNKDQYTPVTNWDLLRLRKENPNNAFDNSILKVVENGVGIQAVLSMVKDALGNISSSLDTHGFAYEVKDGNVVKGAEMILALQQLGKSVLQTIDGIYTGSVSIKSNALLIAAALNWIYDTLPDSAKTLLKIKGGDAKNPELGAKKLIGKLLDSKRLDETSFTYSISSSGKGSNKSGNDDDEDYDGAEKMNSAAQFIMGGGEKSKFIIQDGSLNGFGVDCNSMVITNGTNALGAGSTLLEVTRSTFSGLLDTMNASVAGSFIDPETFDKILVRDGRIHKIDLPVDPNEPSGKIKPDFNALQRKKEADEELKKSGIDVRDKESVKKNYIKINEVYLKKQLPAAYNSEGELIGNNYTTFIVFNADIYSGAVKDGKFESPNRLRKVSSESLLKSIVHRVSKANGEKDDSWFDFDGFWDWDGHDEYYEGTVFIPANKDYYSAQSGSGEKMKMSDFLDIYTRNFGNQEVNRLRQNYNPPDTSK